MNSAWFIRWCQVKLMMVVLTCTILLTTQTKTFFPQRRQAKWLLNLAQVQRRDILYLETVPPCFWAFHLRFGIINQYLPKLEIWECRLICNLIKRWPEAAPLTKNVWLTLWNNTMFTSTSKPKWVLFHSNTRSSQPKKNASMSRENSPGCCHSVYKVPLPIIVNVAAAGCFSWWHLL